VDPGVGGVLFAFDHSGRCVVRARVLGLRFAVHHTGPDQRTPAFGLHFDAQVGEDRLASFFDVREVQEEGENTWATGQKLLATAW